MPKQATLFKRILLLSKVLFILSLSIYTFSYIFTLQYVNEKPEWVLKNPLLILLLGKSSLSGNVFWTSDFISRAYLFIQSFFLVTLALGTVRYSQSKGERHTLLIFSASSLFFTNTASQLMYLFTRISGIKYLNESTAYETGIFWAFKILSLLILISAGTLLVLFKKAESNRDGDYLQEQDLPLKWMRLLHYYVDRILVFFSTAGYLFIPYFYMEYKGMPSNYNKEPETIFQAAGIGFLLVLALTYFITEAVLKFSPGKALTGTMVINTATSESPSATKVLLRSLSRFIPLDSISFWFSAGWHDSVSGTKLSYRGNRPWLDQQTRLTKAVLVIYASILAWLFVSILAGELFHGENIIAREASELPLFLGSFGALLVMSVLVVYIASVYNYTDNLIHLQEFTDSAYLTEIVVCLLPVYNFITFKNVFLRIEANIEQLVKEENQLDKLRSTTATFNWLFPAFYSLACLSLLGFFMSDYRSSAAICAALTAFFLFFIILQFISYLGTIKQLAPLFQPSIDEPSN